MDKKKFQQIIKTYFSNNRSDFPWRDTTDFYKILVSEIMLQQTQTYRVLPKYEKFLERFPTMPDLAKASFSEVLKYWSGLGYNRRALYLQKLAQNFSDNPISNDPKELQKLPGLGKATAASVLVFSENLPLPFIETNIRRVYIHFFFADQEEVSDKDIEKLVEETLDKKNPREWYYALMDYGVMLAATTENANRRSKHYKKQSKFKGSLRKIRGEILRHLIDKPLKKADLYQLIKEDSNRIDAALHGLEKDNLIKINLTNITLS